MGHLNSTCGFVLVSLGFRTALCSATNTPRDLPLYKVVHGIGIRSDRAQGLGGCPVR